MTIPLDFLKVVRLVFWSGMVGPGTNDFYPDVTKTGTGSGERGTGNGSLGTGNQR